MYAIAKGLAIAISALTALWFALAMLGCIWKVPPRRWENLGGAVLTLALLYLSYVFDN